MTTIVAGAHTLPDLARRTELGRDLGPWSTRISSKGALLRETLECLRFLTNSNGLDRLRQAVMQEDLLHKRTRESRLRCWHSLTWRYLWPPGNPVARSLVALARNPGMDMILRGAIFYHHCLADHITYDVATGLLWRLEETGRREVSVADIEGYVVESMRIHPEVGKWAAATRRKVAHSISAALRDFGRLEGKVRKRLARPAIPSELLLYVAHFLRDEGRSAREILFSPDYRLWGQGPEELARAFRQEAARGTIRFEWTGNAVILDLGTGTFDAYAQRLGSQV